jgi:hypothetical protein
MSESRGFSVPDLIEGEAERLASSLRQRLIPHSGELGAAREQVVRDFIQQQLPRRFGVSSGFVFDVHGSISNQMDVIIHDVEQCPVFSAPGGAKFFPCEGVIAVGQVKSNITSAEEYELALQNLRSAKRLDRSTGGDSLSLETAEPIRPTENHLHQIFSFVFVVNRSLQKDSMIRALYEHLWNQPRLEWPNITFVLDQFFLTYSCSAGICPNPMDAFAIGLADKASKAELLLWFVRLLAQAVISTHSASFSYYRYLWGDKPRPWISLAFERAPVSTPIPKHLKEISIPEWWTPNATL